MHALIGRSNLGLFALGIILAACGDGRTPVDPSNPLGVVPVPTPAPIVTAFPQLSRAGVIYDRTTPSSIPGPSRYVIYDDGTFSLQYLRPDWGFFEYLGRYLRAESVLTLNFNDNANSWQARGVLRADSSLTVEYNLLMGLDDFEDGTFRSSRPLAPLAGIYIANADGSGITRLTTGGRPAWSPNGQRIAFQRDGLVYVTSAADSSDVFLTMGSYPAWSPDGHRIVFTDSAGISVMNADGSGITRLISHHFRHDTYAPWDLGVGKPAWSPDGTLIAFEHLGDGDMQPAQIFVMGSDGSNPHTLTTSPQGYKYAESDPAWSPDGSKLAFWSYGYGLATVAATGGVPTTIYMDFPAVAYGTKPTWSSDGSSIAFTVRSNDQPAIWTTSVSAGSPRMLISAGYDAAWSPSGARIAFVSAR
jgi:WD40 repeat protein